MNNLTRRRFIIGTGLTVGFAAAAHPTFAQVITTDSIGLTAGAVRIPTASGEIPGYRAMPATGSSFPIVLVVQEIFGVHEHIQDVCRRFAKLGYCAIAPEMFFRQGDVSQLTDVQQIIGTVVSKVPDAQVMSDLDAAVAWAAASSQGDRSRIGITGFCWGGRITWLYAAHNPSIKAGVAWYGRLVGNSTELNPRHPIDIAPTLTVPVLGLYGGNDTGIPNDTVARMQQALATGRSGSDILLYPATPHAFHADYRPSYRKEEAMDGWRRLQAWFKTHGL
ncbi:MAG: dienelactone hydrolase family protein [Coleofasciculaceae cyanobacterium SM2_1_6]|nr:dienelactone hydrolase family protein [Coleofasciculaceae cyanobacterium SM2_1_6]